MPLVTGARAGRNLHTFVAVQAQVGRVERLVGGLRGPRAEVRQEREHFVLHARGAGRARVHLDAVAVGVGADVDRGQLVAVRDQRTAALERRLGDVVALGVGADSGLPVVGAAQPELAAIGLDEARVEDAVQLDELGHRRITGTRHVDLRRRGVHLDLVRALALGAVEAVLVGALDRSCQVVAGRRGVRIVRHVGQVVRRVAQAVGTDEERDRLLTETSLEMMLTPSASWASARRPAWRRPCRPRDPTRTARTSSGSARRKSSPGGRWAC